jgi:hypothetical protein
MPTSRSPRPPIEPPPRRWPLIVAAIVVLALASIFLLPASMILRFLPPSVHADDFSGSLLHGAAGKLSVSGRDAGAVEWRLRLGSLLHFAVAADIHWVKLGFVIDGSGEIQSHHVLLRNIRGGGPIENLSDFGVAPGWRGIATLNVEEIAGDFTRLDSAVGKIDVANLSSTSIAAGSDLGGYELQLPAGAVGSDGTVTATLTDTGGPVELRAQIQLTPATRTGLLSGTLKEGPDASADLRNQLSTLAQLHARDAKGRFPVDLEFTF